MRILYIECGMGAAGDMLTAALLELLEKKEQDAFIEEMNCLRIPGVSVKKEPSVKCGINGTHVSVTVNGEEELAENHGHCHEGHEGHEHCHEGHEDHGHTHGHDEHGHHHHHSSMHDIEHIVEGLEVSGKVKSDVMAVYGLIAQAESNAHGVPVTEIHFHEVGTMDAIADITAVCVLMERLAVQQVIVSPIHVGSGHVQCAHGILPVPAPATAYILRGVPVYGGSIKGELCTPTGAALLKYFASSFGDMPVMKVENIGYGMGKKDFERANCVRAMLGETEDKTDQVAELNCNVDDMTAEEIGFAMERLFAAGALEVFTVPAGMKKSRPGTLINVLCRMEDRETLVRAVFKYTTTIGIRESVRSRYILDRSITAVQTPFGEIRRKDVSGYGVSRSKYEYEDLAKIAREQDIGIGEKRGYEYFARNKDFR